MLFLWLSVLCSAASAVTLTQQINSSEDDAEERINSGFVYVNSSDLEINYDGGEPQLVGLKFRPINVPQGATICSNTYLQFEADESNAEVTNLIIYAERNPPTKDGFQKVVSLSSGLYKPPER